MRLEGLDLDAARAAARALAGLNGGDAVCYLAEIAVDDTDLAWNAEQLVRGIELICAFRFCQLALAIDALNFP